MIPTFTSISNQGLNLFHLHLLNRCGASDVSQLFTPQSLFGWSRIVKNASCAGFWRDFVEPLVPEVFFKIKDIRNRESSYTYSTVWRNHFKIAKYKFIRIGPQLQQRPVFFWLLELFWTHSKYVRVPKTFWEISSKLPGICCQIAKKDGWAFYRGIHHQCLSIIDLLLGIMIMCQILHIILNPTDLFFEGQPSKTMPLSIKTRAILGSRYMLRHPQHLLQKTWCQHLFRIQSYLPSLTLNLRLRGDHVFPKNHLYTSGESTGVIRLPILDLFWGDQTMQIDGQFEEFTL